MKKIKDLIENDFGEYLYELRKKSGLTIEELVEKIDEPRIREKNIKKWEHDLEFPDLDLMYKLSDIYDEPIEQIMQVKTNALEKGLKGVHRELIHIISYLMGVSIYTIVIASYVLIFVAGIWAMLIWAEVPKRIAAAVGVELTI